MDYEKLKEIRNMGFVKEMGFELKEIREGYACGELVLKPKHAGIGEPVDGGVLFTISDTVGGAAAISRGTYVTTGSGNINFLSEPRTGTKKLVAETREVSVGEERCVYEVIISDESGHKISEAVMVYYYLQGLLVDM